MELRRGLGRGTGCGGREATVLRISFRPGGATLVSCDAAHTPVGSSVSGPYPVLALLLVGMVALFDVPAVSAGNRSAPMPHVGELIGWISIPELHLQAPIRDGTDAAQLNLGPSHYPWTDLPGEGGTVAVAGPQNDLRSLVPPHRRARPGRHHHHQADA